MTMQNLYWDHYVNDYGGPGQDWSFLPAASQTSGGLAEQQESGATFTALRDAAVATGVVGIGPSFGGVHLQAYPSPGLWHSLARGLIVWSLAYMPLGSTIKSAQITLWGSAGSFGGLTGGQVGWVQTDKPLVNDGFVDQYTDYAIDGDDLATLLTDLVSIDDEFAALPAYSEGSRDWLTRPRPMTWNLTPAGVAYLQDVFDNPVDGTIRAAKFRLLTEWDRTNTEPTWPGDDGYAYLGSSAGYRSDDGLIALSPRLRVWV